MSRDRRKKTCKRTRLRCTSRVRAGTSLMRYTRLGARRPGPSHPLAEGAPFPCSRRWGLCCPRRWLRARVVKCRSRRCLHSTRRLRRLRLPRRRRATQPRPSWDSRRQNMSPLRQIAGTAEWNVEVSIRTRMHTHLERLGRERFESRTRLTEELDSKRQNFTRRSCNGARHEQAQYVSMVCEWREWLRRIPISQTARNFGRRLGAALRAHAANARGFSVTSSGKSRSAGDVVSSAGDP